MLAGFNVDETLDWTLDELDIKCPEIGHGSHFHAFSHDRHESLPLNNLLQNRNPLKIALKALKSPSHRNKILHNLNLPLVLPIHPLNLPKFLNRLPKRNRQENKLLIKRDRILKQKLQHINADLLKLFIPAIDALEDAVD